MFLKPSQSFFLYRILPVILFMVLVQIAFYSRESALQRICVFSNFSSELFGGRSRCDGFLLSTDNSDRPLTSTERTLPDQRKNIISTAQGLRTTSSSNSHGIQTTTFNTHWIQTIESDSLGVQTTPSNSHGIQSTTSNSLGIQATKFNSNGIQATTFNSRGILTTKFNSSGIQTTTSNSNRLKTTTSSSNGLQTTTSNSNRLQKTTSNSHEIQATKTNSKRASVFATKFKQKTTTKLPEFSEEKNRQCLEHLLKVRIVEYYYPPENDDNGLDFSVKGFTANAKLGPKFSEPILVLCDLPVRTYNKSKVPREICSDALLNYLPIARAEDFDTIRSLLKFFKHIAKLIDMAYYLNYGSLLGHVRFNGRPSPWDDDVDLAIDFSKRALFEKTCLQKRNNLTTYRQVPFRIEVVGSSDRTKLCLRDNPRVGRYKFTYPFLDIFFFHSNVEDFYDLPEDLLSVRNFSDAFHSSYIHNFPVETILPFKHERFLGLELNVPARPKEFLKEMNYINSKCKIYPYNHRTTAIYKKKSEIPCKKLIGFYDISDFD